MKFLCWFKNHRWTLVANFNDTIGQRGLYQCVRCKKVTIDVSSNSISKDRLKKVGNDIEYGLFH